MSAEFSAFLREHGLQPGIVAPDGKIRSCPTDSHPKKKNGRYMLAIDQRFGWLQDWAIMESPVTWRAEGGTSGGAERQIDYEALRRQRDEQRAAQKRATLAAREFYDRCQPLRGGHPYLEAHGLDMTGCVGLRIDRDGWLVIPAMRQGHLISLQRIAAPGVVPEGEPTKKFWYGAPFGGVSYLVDRPGASITVLCEGLATGLAIYTAAPLTRVLVAFTVSNMAKVAEFGRMRGMVCVAADNDYQTEARTGTNPGVEGARKAAAILGCGVAIPRGIQGTDWADFRQERLAALARQGSYGRRGLTENGMRRTVDAEVSMEIMKNSKSAICPTR